MATASSSSVTGEYVPEKNYISYKNLISNLKKKRPKFSRLDDNPNSAIVWFKSDLRIFDNPALYFGAKFCREKNRKLNLIGLFVFCEEEMKTHGYADCKILLLLKAVESLKEELWNQFNVHLIVINIEDPLDVPEGVVKFCMQVGGQGVFFNKQYERDENIRDGIVESELKRYDIEVASYHDQCVIAPATLKTTQGRDFVVFTPFKKSWLANLESKNGKEYLRVYDMDELGFQNGDHVVATTFDTIEDLVELTEDLESSCSDIFSEENNWLTTEMEVLELADEFIMERASRYDVDRDFPAINGTSKLSPYLALGMISIKYLVAKCRGANDGKLSTGSNGLVIWIKELCWRDFYRNILVCYPYVCMNKPFKRETEALKWKDDEEIFEKWCHGKTGFPIVDAAMRQLNGSGWMHNRLRMVVAMFLTKDLLINWQWGEKYFMSKLIDGDFASNNGGWQWSSSTGTDAQPYFRVFNPLLQSKKFDAKGEFIRKWVPELRELDSKAVHDPYGQLSKAEFRKLGYPKPIVNHSVAKEEAINAFKVLYGKK